MSNSDKQRNNDAIQQRIKEKKERQKANPLKAPVLKVIFSNAIEAYSDTLHMKEILQQKLAKQKQQLAKKKLGVNAVDNLEREPHTKIAIKSDFYASEIIPTNIKEFYRKSSNSFQKLQIAQKRALSTYVQKQAVILSSLDIIRKLEDTLRNTRQTNRSIKQDQIVANMQQRVRYEDQLQRGSILHYQIQDLNKRNDAVAKQYDFKKNHLNNMEQRVTSLKLAIEKQIKRYEESYNIINYREYLKKMFEVRLKIDVLESQVRRSAADIDMQLSKTSRLEDSLEKTNHFVRYGKIQTYRTNSKNTHQRKHSAISVNTSTNQKQSTNKQNTSSLKTDRTTPTNKKTRRRLFSEIY